LIKKKGKMRGKKKKKKKKAHVIHPLQKPSSFSFPSQWMSFPLLRNLRPRGHFRDFHTQSRPTRYRMTSPRSPPLRITNVFGLAVEWDTRAGTGRATVNPESLLPDIRDTLSAQALLITPSWTFPATGVGTLASPLHL